METATDALWHRGLLSFEAVSTDGCDVADGAVAQTRRRSQFTARKVRLASFNDNYTVQIQTQHAQKIDK